LKRISAGEIEAAEKKKAHPSFQREEEKASLDGEILPSPQGEKGWRTSQGES